MGDTPNGSSIYHGLQTQLSRRFSNGLMFQAAYTWSRTIDNSTADFLLDWPHSSSSTGLPELGGGEVRFATVSYSSFYGGGSV